PSALSLLVLTPPPLPRFLPSSPTRPSSDLSLPLPEAWAQPMVIETRGGAGGNIGTAAVARAAPDGYTILLTTSGLMSNPSLYKDAGFHPVRDFAPVTVVGNSATIVVRHPSLEGVNTMRDIEALARKEKVACATAGIGLAGHLAGELFRTMTKVDRQAIPFAGAAPAITAVLSGQVKLGFMAVPSTVPHVKSGKLVAIAVTSPKRLAVLPHLPPLPAS